MAAVGILTSDQVHAVLSAAITAPSRYNSQPWRFRCTPSAIEVYADDAVLFPQNESASRDLRMACGAALLNLRVAITGLGVHPVVRLLPNQHRPDLLASVRPQGRRGVTPEDLALLAAIPRRRTNRRPFATGPVPTRVINNLRRAAKLEQSWLARVTPPQLPRLRAMIRQARATRQRDPAFRSASAIRAEQERVEPREDWLLRDLVGPAARPPRPGPDDEPNPLLVAVGSFHDVPLAHLQAGQAMQRVLLTATAEGLSASFMSQVVEVAGVRRQLRVLVGGGLWPQVVLRLGYGSRSPATARRPLAEVVDNEMLSIG
jgi:nitroreductase